MGLTPHAVAEHLDVLQDQWAKSLAYLGDVAHRGDIPATAITRHCVYDHAIRPHRTFAMTDFSINVINYLHEQHTLRQLVAWMFQNEPLLPWVDDEDEGLRAHWLSESVDRTGVEVFVHHQ